MLKTISLALITATTSLALQCDETKGLIDIGVGSCICENPYKVLNENGTNCVFQPLLKKSGRRL